MKTEKTIVDTDMIPTIQRRMIEDRTPQRIGTTQTFTLYSIVPLVSASCFELKEEAGSESWKSFLKSTLYVSALVPVALSLANNSSISLFSSILLMYLLDFLDFLQQMSMQIKCKQLPLPLTHLTSTLIPTTITTVKLRSLITLTSPVCRDIPWKFGPLGHTCIYCGAIMWYEEQTRKDRKLPNPKFNFSCLEGCIQLPLMKTKRVTFHKDIRNAMFAFTSLGTRVVTSVNCGKGTYTESVGFCCILSVNNPNLDNFIFMTPKMRRPTKSMHQRECTALDVKLTNELSEMLEEHNILIRYEAKLNSTFYLCLITDRRLDGHQYHIPNADEVVGLIVGDLSDSNLSVILVSNTVQMGYNKS
ncbi:hypothetical protein OSB04_006345 [Centaurea solstitialis]|uniref:Uncharacterized protein n=1 Tax=Centaurea solstitialis TaxID=347529 RepID=A0AA38WQ92_9ASTR|nr:hypothetical protein OSB04_006345 [Centaurea solstitialis]